jgi:hypothetical protein
MNSDEAYTVLHSIEGRWPRTTSREEAREWVLIMCSNSDSVSLAEAQAVIDDLTVQSPDRRPTPAHFKARLQSRRPRGGTPADAPAPKVDPEVAKAAAQEAMAELRASLPQLWRGKKVTL